MPRIIKFVKVLTATALTTYDFARDNDELAGLNKAIRINAIGWVGSDAGYDTLLSIQDGQLSPIQLYNHDTVANGYDMEKHTTYPNWTPESGDIKITIDANLGAGDMILFIDAIIP